MLVMLLLPPARSAIGRCRCVSHRAEDAGEAASACPARPVGALVLGFMEMSKSFCSARRVAPLFFG